VDEGRFCRCHGLRSWEPGFIRHAEEIAISYRIELGALLLAIAASGAIGRVQRRRHSPSQRRLRRAGTITTLVAGVAGASLLGGCGSSSPVDVPKLIQTASPGSAMAALGSLAVKGRAPKTGYARSQFGAAWADVDRNGCDTRDDILRRDLTALRYRASTGGCVVIAGTLADPYTGAAISFTKADASAVQIDHVVALSDAWQTGAQQLPSTTRRALANDPLNLLAVDGPANQQKGDGDAATWLPPRKSFRCTYVSRQVAVKTRYQLWVTPAERDAIARVLRSCPDQALPS
jgi:hypothetical protein